MSKHYYYLHTNGDLIHKRDLDGGQVADFRDSDFVRMFWRLDTTQRYDAWRVLVEAKALGGNEDRINELAAKWNCNDHDAHHFADCLGLDLFMDGNAWCCTRQDFVDLQHSPAGFGSTCLEAFSDLLRELDFRPSKTWGHTIKDLCQVGAA